METWVTVVSAPNYEISTLGRVRKGTYVLKTHLNAYGYFALRIDGKTRVLHRLIAEAFIPNPFNYPLVDHINRDKTDNRVQNLRWATKQQNALNCSRADGDDKGILFWKNGYMVRVGSHYLGRCRTIEGARELRRQYLSTLNNESPLDQVAEPRKEMESNLHGRERE